jgi:hypothetical protein
MLTDVWHHAIGTHPDPPPPVVLATAVLALAVVMPHRAWRISRNVVTIAHEGGHALTALMTGRRLTGIRLHSDTSGVTVSVGRPTGPGMVFTALAGYITPSLLGLCGAAILATGHVTALLWTSIVLLGAMLIMIRNIYGALSVVATGGTVFAVSWFGTATTQAAFAYLFIWFLLIAGVRPIFELQRKRRRGRAPHSDADQLAQLTGVHPLFWVAFFAVVAGVSLVAGASWLVA